MEQMEQVWNKLEQKQNAKVPTFENTLKNGTFGTLYYILILYY